MSEVSARKLAADFKIVMGDVEELIRATASQSGERVGDLRQRLEKKIEDGRKALAEKTWFQTAEEAKARDGITFARKSLGGIGDRHRSRRASRIPDAPA